MALKQTVQPAFTLERLAFRASPARSKHMAAWAYCPAVYICAPILAHCSGVDALASRLVTCIVEPALRSTCAPGPEAQDCTAMTAPESQLAVDLQLARRPPFHPCPVPAPHGSASTAPAWEQLPLGQAHRTGTCCLPRVASTYKLRSSDIRTWCSCRQQAGAMRCHKSSHGTVPASTRHTDLHHSARR
jgi:hypothetical protein